MGIQIPKNQVQQPHNYLIAFCYLFIFVMFFAPFVFGLAMDHQMKATENILAEASSDAIASWGRIGSEAVPWPHIFDGENISSVFWNSGKCSVNFAQPLGRESYAALITPVVTSPDGGVGVFCNADQMDSSGFRVRCFDITAETEVSVDFSFAVLSGGN